MAWRTQQDINVIMGRVLDDLAGLAPRGSGVTGAGDEVLVTLPAWQHAGET